MTDDSKPLTSLLRSYNPYFENLEFPTPTLSWRVFLYVSQVGGPLEFLFSQRLLIPRAQMLCEVIINVTLILTCVCRYLYVLEQKSEEVNDIIQPDHI